MAPAFDNESDVGGSVPFERARPFRFLDLPLEIRHLIYRYLLEAKHLDFPDGGLYHPPPPPPPVPSPSTPVFACQPRASYFMKKLREARDNNSTIKEPGTRCAIFCTNKQIYSESVSVFYSANLFVRIVLQHNWLRWEGELTQTPFSGVVCSRLDLTSRLTQHAVDLVLTSKTEWRSPKTSQLVAPAAYLPEIFRAIRQSRTHPPPKESLTLHTRVSPRYEGAQLAKVRKMLESEFGGTDGRLNVFSNEDGKGSRFSSALKTYEPKRENESDDESLGGYHFQPQLWFANLEFLMSTAQNLLKGSANPLWRATPLFRRVLDIIRKAGNSAEGHQLRAQPSAFQKSVNELRLNACLQFIHHSPHHDKNYSDQNGLLLMQEVAILAEDIAERRLWPFTWEKDDSVSVPHYRKERDGVKFHGHPEAEAYYRTRIFEDDADDDGQTSEVIARRGIVAYYRAMTYFKRDVLPIQALPYMQQAQRLIPSGTEVFGLKVSGPDIDHGLEQHREMILRWSFNDTANFG